ncbi:MAG: DUF1292 domain-containing protein [Bacilli bacterium]|nr:DUF1292 domain-containing protein [Bacilli bacterium]
MEEMKNFEVVTLEDGIKYIVAHEIDNYLLLINSEDETDFCIRKNVIENGKEYIESLDSDEEFDKAIKLFANFIKN